MKKVIFILFALYSSFCFSQVLKDTLNGKVKTITDEIFFHNKDYHSPNLFTEDREYGYSAILFPNPIWRNVTFTWYNSNSTLYINSKKTYNKKGFPIRETIYNLKGKSIKDFYSKYDKNNNLIQFKGNNSVRNYTYNKKNNRKTYLHYENEDSNSYEYNLFIYNEKDSLVHIKEYTEEGPSFETKFEYENLNKKVFLSYLGMKYLKKEFFFDKKNKLIKEIHYQGGFYKSDTIKPKINYIIRKKYSEHLLIKTTKSHSNDSIFSIEELFYDKKNRIKKRQIITPNKEESNWSLKYYYDKLNNIIKVILFKDRKEYIIDFKYVFDKKDNWIKQTKFINGEKIYSWKRKIKYF